MASAGKVTGDIKEINEVFDWIWYHIQKTGKEVSMYLMTKMKLSKMNMSKSHAFEL